MITILLLLAGARPLLRLCDAPMGEPEVLGWALPENDEIVSYDHACVWLRTHMPAGVILDARERRPST
jgi:hypothetical protein